MQKKNIDFKNFNLSKKKLNNSKVIKIFKDLKKNLLDKKDLLLFSMSNKYENSFKTNELEKYRKFKFYKIIAMGGSILGSKAIYFFLKFKIKKDFKFIDNLNLNKQHQDKRKQLDIIISKSGNTLETISNMNIRKINKDSIFITEDKDNYLRKIAHKLKKKVFEHKNYIGGRYSVLSETGMLPAILMGLDYKKFKKIDYYMNNKMFVDRLILNVSNILTLYNDKKTNSIILNYDENSQDLFHWYQQLVAESLGKKSKGILPFISLMPKDNHSLMQLYLDGTKNNFFTFFMVEDKKSKNIKKENLVNFKNYLKNKNLQQVLRAQFFATQSIFKKKKIPFRSFVVKQRNEEALGELFIYFILETIMLGKAMNVNPFDQPQVESIKKETYKFLRKN